MRQKKGKLTLSDIPMMLGSLFILFMFLLGAFQLSQLLDFLWDIGYMDLLYYIIPAMICLGTIWVSHDRTAKESYQKGFLMGQKFPDEDHIVLEDGTTRAEKK